MFEPALPPARIASATAKEALLAHARHQRRLILPVARRLATLLAVLVVSGYLFNRVVTFLCDQAPYHPSPVDESPGPIDLRPAADTLHIIEIPGPNGSKIRTLSRKPRPTLPADSTPPVEAAEPSASSERRD